jgi:hypothetical protein
MAFIEVYLAKNVAKGQAENPKIVRASTKSPRISALHLRDDTTRFCPNQSE